MSEYETTFTNLSRHVGPLVADEEEKCQKFLDGLNPLIEARVRMFHITTFPEIVNAALEAEAIEQRIASTRKNEGKKSAFSHLPEASWFRSKKPQRTRQSGYDHRVPGESSGGSELGSAAVSATSPL